MLKVEKIHFKEESHFLTLKNVYVVFTDRFLIVCENLEMSTCPTWYNLDVIESLENVTKA